MKKFIATIVVLFFLGSVQSQELPSGDPNDVASIDAIIAAVYDVISGPAGEKRDWDRMRSLFIPEAVLMPSGKNAQTGDVGYRYWSLEDYINKAGSNLEKDGFFEVEVARRVEKYGTIAHVFSTYESRRNKNDDKPFARGINSIQLLKGKDRWYIVSIFWMGESPEYPIPESYLVNG
ncbi:hypothetical protein [Flagellimonas meridianipacifica]|uniref:Nuclear transport factor 2 family protein n=1 Tax=Flagellimonas meridianipacifica TaxID=1080225 RepID=A0A2T0MH71_9FLAO|nr:hypothetical protein [Allomuricauda pacifica]PRX56886.1 hypothetical protein CLV81_0886 [Allomuricauda pacifica]